ncbi:MAG: hypothetical protein K2P64_08970 [Lachnospiraceae bacterium]|nr:hypothetical protein [Lachnospiraceae bacterium]
MRKTDRKQQKWFLAAVLCSAVLLSLWPSGTAYAVQPESVIKLRTEGIDDPVVTEESWSGDYVSYSDCYVYRENFKQEEFQSLLPAPTLYRVADAYRYDRETRKRVMDLQSVADGAMKSVGLREIAFISAAAGGKDSSFRNGGDIRPVAKKEVEAWKFTVKNPYDEEKNPTGMRAPEISNVRLQGRALCFDYAYLYSTGNCYLSAILTTERGTEIIGYDRLVDASYRGNGTAIVNWPEEYDEKGYVLKVFAEKYNGDHMTDYISEIQYVYKGAAID